MDFSPTDLTQQENYKLLSGSVVPRPIAFVSTRSPKGIHNVAPFSFFNLVSSEPPTIMFSINHSSSRIKDTLANIERHPEFVVNIVTEDIIQQMNNASSEFMPDVSEFDEIGLTPVPAKFINCMAVGESPIQLECSLLQILTVGKNSIVFGKVVHYHIDDYVYMDGYKINMEKLRPVARLAGNSYSIIQSPFQLEKSYDPDKVVQTTRIIEAQKGKEA